MTPTSVRRSVVQSTSSSDGEMATRSRALRRSGPGGPDRLPRPTLGSRADQRPVRQRARGLPKLRGSCQYEAAVKPPSMQYPGPALQAAHPGLDEKVNGILDTVFFASLEKEEGEAVRISVVFHPQGADGLRAAQQLAHVGGASFQTSVWQVLQFSSNSDVTPFTVENLVKIAAVTAARRTAIVVGEHDGELAIVGVARRIERGYYPSEQEKEALVLVSHRPGEVLITQHGLHQFLYRSGQAVAVGHRPLLWDLLNDRTSKVQIAMRQICRGLLSAVLPGSHFQNDCYHFVAQALSKIIDAMVHHGHGGILTIVPESVGMEEGGKYRFDAVCRDALRQAIERVVNDETAVFDAWSQRGADEDDDGDFERGAAEVLYEMARARLGEVAENIGLLSAVDNAVVLGGEMQLIAAGYILPNRKDRPHVKEASNLAGSVYDDFPLDRFGSRHNAAASFSDEHPGVVTFLSSEDGALRCFHKSDPGGPLLVWNILSAADL